MHELTLATTNVHPVFLGGFIYQYKDAIYCPRTTLKACTWYVLKAKRNSPLILTVFRVFNLEVWMRIYSVYNIPVISDCIWMSNTVRCHEIICWSTRKPSNCTGKPRLVRLDYLEWIFLVLLFDHMRELCSDEARLQEPWRYCIAFDMPFWNKSVQVHRRCPLQTFSCALENVWCNETFSYAFENEVLELSSVEDQQKRAQQYLPQCCKPWRSSLCPHLGASAHCYRWQTWQIKW
jgi:hypothetical protein